MHIVHIAHAHWDLHACMQLLTYTYLYKTSGNRLFFYSFLHLYILYNNLYIYIYIYIYIYKIRFINRKNRNQQCYIIKYLNIPNNSSFFLSPITSNDLINVFNKF